VALTSRLATRGDLPLLLPLIEAAIDELQRGFLDEAQIKSSHAIMGIDTQLIDDGTYFVIELEIRAMYTHPAFVRRGVGRMIISLCEAAAKAEGFESLELMATLSGQPLYEAAGFEPVEWVQEPAGGTPVPLIKMRRAIGS
jgi:GNAT superfamily N-acetyltransferase